MVDAFCATWKLVDSQNFDDYMKALGEHVYLFKSVIIVNCIYMAATMGCTITFWLFFFSLMIKF